MKAMMMEPLLRDATIKAIDAVAKKLTKAERAAETKATRLMARWNEMDQTEKEHVAGIAVAALTTAATAIVALRSRGKTPRSKAKKTGKNLVSRVAKKIF